MSAGFKNTPPFSLSFRSEAEDLLGLSIQVQQNDWIEIVSGMPLRR